MPLRTRKNKHTHTVSRERALEKQVAALTAHIKDIERRMTRLGLAKQPTDKPQSDDKQWGLPPKEGEVRLQIRDDNFTEKDLCWY